MGSIAVYDRIPYPASAIALEPVTMIRVPATEYFDLLDRHPAFTHAVMRELTRLSLALTRKLGEMRGQRVDARIARLFLALAQRMGRRAGETIEIPVVLTRQEIAELVGTTVESAIRVMSRWGREGLVVTGESGFRIPSLERLRTVVGDPNLDGPGGEP